MEETKSLSVFSCIPVINELLNTELYCQDHDAPVTDVMLATVTKKVQAKLNTVFSLNRGDSVYVDDQNDVHASDMHLLYVLYKCADIIYTLTGSNDIEINILSIHGDVFIKQLPR